MKKFVWISISVIVVIALLVTAFFALQHFGVFDDPFDFDDDVERDDHDDDRVSVCTVTFDSNGGSDVPSQKIKRGELAEYPQFPVKEGYLFVGWYTNAKFEELFDFSAPIKKSCKAVARWINVDDATDTDLDGLTDALEEYFNTDKSDPDTDSDGLTDYWEKILGLDPLSADTDENGIEDGYDDVDCDRVNNAQEIYLGTDPLLADTDGDGLSDGDEINTYYTNALLSDTDGDGANDFWEIENYFDPCAYNLSFYVTVASDGATDSTVTATVEMEADGKQASLLTVETVPEDENILLSASIPGYLGQAYEFSTLGEFYSATISFSYPLYFGELSEDFQPRIYYFNEEESVLEELDNQIVTDGVVIAEVSHFSKYILLNKAIYDLAWESDIVIPSMAEERGVDVKTDSNYDGIPDYYSELIKEGRLLSSTGQDLFGGIDFGDVADYDGDGVDNGDEIVVVEVAYRVFYIVKSDPTVSDSDLDGLSDGEDPNPLIWDVSYRDLALLAEAVYYDIPAGTFLTDAQEIQRIIMLSDDLEMVVGRLDELRGWQVVEAVYNPFTGFEASAYAKDNSIVIATRGSEKHDTADVLQDWVTADVLGYLFGFNAQLPAMETFIDYVSQKYGDSYDNFYVTGHSLGGYLALMSASQLVEHGLGDKIEDVITFNALGLSNSPVNKIGWVFDIDDNVYLQLIRGKIKNYRTFADVVSIIGYTPGNDVTVDSSPYFNAINVLDAHRVTNFIERFSNEARHPYYDVTLYGLNDELKEGSGDPGPSDGDSNGDSNGDSTDRVIDTPYYTLTVPKEWTGKFVHEVISENHGTYELYHLNIAEKKSYEQNYTGVVIALFMSNRKDGCHYENAGVVKSFIMYGETYDIWVLTLTDMDVIPDGIENYQLLCSGVDEVLESIKLKNVVTEVTDDGETPPSSGKICLSELDPILSEHYEGNEGDSRFFILEGEEYRNGNVGMNGEYYQNGFEVWLARWNDEEEMSWVRNVYDLGGRYTNLSGKTGLIAESYNVDNFNTTLCLYGDGALLGSMTLTGMEYEGEFDIDVTGVNELEIIVADNVAVCGGTSLALYDLFLTVDSSGSTTPSGPSDEFSWEFDPETGTVTLRGTGAMPNYHCDNNPSPWDELFYNDLVKHIVIEEGITSVGSFTCWGVTESVTIPNSVTLIEYAALDCAQLQTIYYQGTEDDWVEITIIPQGNWALEEVEIVCLGESN